MTGARLRTWIGLHLAAAVATGFAACSGGSTGSRPPDSGTDASTDAADEGTILTEPDTGAFLPDDGGGGGEGIDLLSPDGCYRLGASCVSGSTCCSALCVEASCSQPTVQM